MDTKNILFGLYMQFSEEKNARLYPKNIKITKKFKVSFVKS